MNASRKWIQTSNGSSGGDLIVTGNIANIHPLSTFVVAAGYAVVALTLPYFLPRYKGAGIAVFDM
jgi:hypothetical protein